VSEPSDFRVSYSSLNLASACLRKFEFNKLYPRKSRDGEEQYAADVGKAIHAAVQHWLIHQDPDAALWQLMRHFPYVWEFNQIRDDRNLEAAIATLDEIIDSCDDMTEWELVSIKLEDGSVVPAIEVPFEIRLKNMTLSDGRQICYTGWIDAIMRHKGTGMIRTLDIKTHRSTLRDATAKYKFDTQQIPYGIIVEHLQGNEVEEFEVLYLDCFIDLVEPRVTLYPFLKIHEDLEEWMLDTVLDIRRIQTAHKMNYFSRARGGCLAWNRPCYFLDVCEIRDRESIESWLLEDGEAQPEQDWLPWIRVELDMGVTEDVESV
jgi:hypothetical protein